MNNSVVIKGLKHGIVVVLNQEIEYEELKVNIAKKFSESAKFLGDEVMAVRFEGRELSDEQQVELVELITKNSNLQIACILDNDTQSDEVFKRALDRVIIQPDEEIHEEREKNKTNGQFYKGNLRSGQQINTDVSIVVIGDVNPGASVTSKGNIVILGSLKGNVYAGAGGNESAFVMALDMHPVQIRIADTIARSPDNPVKSDNKDTRIAFLENGNIYIEEVNRKVLGEIKL